MKALPTWEEVSHMLRIEPELGKIFWANAAGSKSAYLFGREAGYPKSSKGGVLYHTVKIGDQPIRRGRLIFFFVHGHWPHPVLDHINGDSTDDRISNLREATIRENCRNRKLQRGRSLPLGVSAAGRRYAARITTEERTFNLGNFKTPEEAAAVYRAKRLELFGEFA